MSLSKAIIMGIIQGLTEFLPVSSSGHLAIFKTLFHVDTDTGLLFDVLLHLGTLIAISLVYYKDIWKLIKEGCGLLIDFFADVGIFFQKKVQQKDIDYRRVINSSYRKFALLIVVSTIPTAIIGYMAKDLVEAASGLLFIPGICLIITGILLLISDRLQDGVKTPKSVTYSNAFVIGICQGIATMPGLSRSGTTITACLISRFDRKFAVKYSFIMSIPAVLGALVLQLKDIGTMPQIALVEIVYYFVGTLIAAVIGFVCIKTMLVIVQKKKFTYFAIYCFVVGALSIGGYFVLS